MAGAPGKSVGPARPGTKQAPAPIAGTDFLGRANQLDQIIRERFDEGTLTYANHGYANNRDLYNQGYRVGHAIDIGPIGSWGVMASGAAKAEGDEIAAFLLRNWDAFGLKNVIWYERICTDGKTWKHYDWEPYFKANPGSSRNPTTHRHGDHVHCQIDKDGLIGSYVP